MVRTADPTDIHTLWGVEELGEAVGEGLDVGGAEAEGVNDEGAIVELSVAGVDGRITLAKSAAEGEGARATVGPGGVEGDFEAGRCLAVRGLDEATGDGVIAESGGDGVEPFTIAGEIVVVAAGGEEIEGREESDDLFLGDLHGTAEAVAGQTLEQGLVDEVGGRVPELGVVVVVEHLKGGGGDEIAAATEDAGGLRTADGLAAGEADEVGPGGDEAGEVRARGEFSGGVDEDSESVGAGEGHDLGQWGAGVGGLVEEDGDGVGGEGGLVLPEFGAADTGVADDLVEADVDEFGPGCADGMVVAVALFAGDEELAPHAGGIGEAFHAAGVEPGEDRGGTEGECGGGTGGDEARFGPGVSGDLARGGGLELFEGDGEAGGVEKGGKDLVGHDRAAEAGDGAGGVDDRGEVESAVGGHGRTEQVKSDGVGECRVGSPGMGVIRGMERSLPSAEPAIGGQWLAAHGNFTDEYVRRTSSPSSENVTDNDGLEVRRTRLLVDELPTGSLPFWMNPSHPLSGRNTRFRRIPPDVLHDVPKMFLVSNDAVVAFFCPEGPHLTEGLIHMQ
jgi:hypothetical protein